MNVRAVVRTPRPFAALLAAIAYIPALLSSPGRMPSDTKLYLYLDPGRLLSTSSKTWDPSLYGGWVPHQMIAYLWPSGPWFWMCEQVGAPDWVAHRLWIATILFLGGLGVFALARALRLPLLGAAISALVYQLSPYVLPYISRTSVMLLPWAALGWLTLLTMRSVQRGGWRYPALLALVVLTVSSVNATAFATILPGPMLWVLFEWHARRVTRRQVVSATARIAVLAVPVSVWWIVMLSIQGRYGADVLAYSETLQAVSGTASSTEVVRSLGYWLFYIRDPYAAATTSSIPYQESAWLIVVGFALALLCLAGLALTRFRHRRYAIALVLTGLVLSVGVHPYADPAPLPSLIRDTGLGLALRSSTRALPLLSLGMAFGVAAFVVAIHRHRPRHGRVAALVVVGLVALNLPSLWTADLVDPALSRDQAPPAAWREAAAALDRSSTGSRVLQIPGAEFGAFRWGYTVDQPLSGLTSVPVVTRDLLPLGSPQLMDLLYALDNRVQNGSLQSDSIAPVARYLAVNQLWIANDLSFDRFRTPRPEAFADLFIAPRTGLGAAVAYGTPTVNRPDIPMIDEQSLSDPTVGSARPPVLLVPVKDAPQLIRVGGRVVVLDGSGDGVVDASAAGVLLGDEVLRYVNDLTAADWAALPTGTVVVVTDSNRDRAAQWRGSQDTIGMTESGGSGNDGVRIDESAQRLPIFTGNGTAATQTVATLDHGLTVQATAYGEPYAYQPEYRAAMAVDGNPATSWRVMWQPVGETLTIAGAATTTLHLLQAQAPDLTMMITAVDIAVDGHRQHAVLDASSLSGTGQDVTIPSGSEVHITIAGVGPRPGAPATGQAWVGFAEVGPTAQEWVRPPTTALAFATANTPVALVFTREWVRSTNRWRSDPEPVLARVVSLSHPIDGTLTVSLHRSDRAGDSSLDGLSALTDAPTSNRRLTGVADARASRAFDGDPSTRWTSPFDTAAGSVISVPLLPDSNVSSLRLQQPTSPDLSTITSVTVHVGPMSADVEVPPAGADGFSTITFPAATGDHLQLEVTGVRRETTRDRRYGDLTSLPVAISEISGLPLAQQQGTSSAACRTDLLTIDGRPVPLQVDTAALATGETAKATLCDGAALSLAPGEHRFLSTAGSATGIDLNSLSVVPTSAQAPTASAPTATVHIDAQDDTSATLTVEPCVRGCWLIFGQGQSSGWTATADGTTLPQSQPVSGGANGWFLPASTAPTHVQIRFQPQRTLNLALGVSAVATAMCIALLVVPLLRRRRPTDTPTRAAEHEQTARFVAPWHRSTPRAARSAAAVLVVATAAFVSLWWAVGALLVAAVLLTGRRLRMAGVASVLGIGALGVLITAVEVYQRYAGDGGWPSHFERIHRAGMFLLLLMVVTIFTGDDEPISGSAGDAVREHDDV
ncbi:unannotated protein [freshwater metagenome]|uniref:Unannotated protein n=1 Tax=freshwater metagenome TaxID=449393 RepID=A0A6J7JSD1_9ZZZZ